MKVAVVGGTGLVGRRVVEALRAQNHEVVTLARSLGADVLTGSGLDEVLVGAQAVIDVTNMAAADAAAAEAFFGTATEQLLAAEQRAGVRHHVVLSIVGIDRVVENAHYAGKRRQEELVVAGPIPYTIVRATQFYEFAEMVVGWTREGDTATLPPLLVQPLTVADLAQVLAELATAAPQGLVLELAGPEVQDFVDMARRVLTVKGDSVRLVPSWRVGIFGPEMAGEVLLPGADARLTATTFETWLGTVARPAAREKSGEEAAMIKPRVDNLYVPAGRDYLGKRLNVEGVVPLDRKVLNQAGGFFVYEHRNPGVGGPPRHLHYDQDEWLYVVSGDFTAEIGDERYVLHAGDSLLAPRTVPHAWIHANDEPATLLFAAQPAGTMEAFFEYLSRTSGPLPWDELENLYAAHGMKLLGPPLSGDEVRIAEQSKAEGSK